MQIQSLAFLLFFQSVVACQQVQENAPQLAANLDFKAAADSRQEPENAPLPATDILFQSTDGGQSWQDISAGLPGDLPVDCFLAHNGDLFLGYQYGLYRGKTTSAAPPVWEKEFLLNQQFTGVFPGRAGVYARSWENRFFQKLSSGIWIPVFDGLKNESFRTFFEARDGTLFIGSDSGIFKSADLGKSWKHVHKHGWMIHMEESNGVLLCTNEGGILRSTDGGETWNLVISEGGVGIDVEVIEGGFAAITYNTESETRRIRISADGGKTWQAIDADLPPHANIASIKQVGEYFFCGHPDGIFRSADRGKTWKLMLPAIKEKVFNLSVSGNVIYAIPKNGGC